MNRHTKKMTAWATTALLLAGLTAGCGKGAGPAETPPAVDSVISESQAAESVAEEITEVATPYTVTITALTMKYDENGAMTSSSLSAAYVFSADEAGRVRRVVRTDAGMSAEVAEDGTLSSFRDSAGAVSGEAETIITGDAFISDIIKNYSGAVILDMMSNDLPTLPSFDKLPEQVNSATVIVSKEEEKTISMAVSMPEDGEAGTLMTLERFGEETRYVWNAETETWEEPGNETTDSELNGLALYEVDGAAEMMPLPDVQLLYDKLASFTYAPHPDPDPDPDYAVFFSDGAQYTINSETGLIVDSAAGEAAEVTADEMTEIVNLIRE